MKKCQEFLFNILSPVICFSFKDYQDRYVHLNVSHVSIRPLDLVLFALLPFIFIVVQFTWIGFRLRYFIFQLSQFIVEILLNPYKHQDTSRINYHCPPILRESNVE